MRLAKYSFESRRSHLLVSGVGVLFAAVLYLCDPSNSTLFPKCWFFTLFALHCPGCGVQRAAHAILHGHVLDAARLNLLSLCAGPFLALAYYRWSARLWGGARTQVQQPRPRLIATIAVFIVAFWVLRNIPSWPFQLLSPAIDSGLQ